jgi:hypothetical protein
MLFSDHVYDSETGIVTFDTFNFDGVLGDRFLVNGKVQPVMHVHPRRYRFRWLDAGPSRFYQLFFTDTSNLNQRIKFHQISTDGNLLERPVEVESVRISVAERADVIIDFSKYAGKTLYIENRLEQEDGRGPTGKVLAAGRGKLVPITELPQHRAAFFAETMHPGKVSFKQQVQHQIRVTPIILLPARSLASNFCRIAQPNRVAQFRQHLFEPGAVTTGFKGHDYLPSKLLVERAHVILLMLQLPAMNLAIGRVTVTNRLFTRMKIHGDVYCHRAPPFVIRKSTGLEFTQLAAGGAFS